MKCHYQIALFTLQIKNETMQTVIQHAMQLVLPFTTNVYSVLDNLVISYK